MQQNVQIVQQAYDDFKKGNIQAILAVLADDVHWELPQIEGIPFTGKRTGRSGVGEFFAGVAESQEVLAFEPREYVTGDGEVVAFGYYKWRVRSTGKQFESYFAHRFSFRNGKVSRFQEYLDTAAAEKAYRQ